MLEKSLESSLDCKEIKPVKPVNIQEINPEYSLKGLMLKLKLHILWPLNVKSQLTAKDPNAGKD